MASVRGGQNSTIRTVGRGLGMPVVHLSVGMDSLCSLCICEHKKTRLVVHKKPGHARVTNRLTLHALVGRGGLWRVALRELGGRPQRG